MPPSNNYSFKKKKLQYKVVIEKNINNILEIKHKPSNWGLVVEWGMEGSEGDKSHVNRISKLSGGEG